MEGGHELSEEFLALPGAVPFADVWADRYESTPFLVKHAGRAARSRTAFYHLGFGTASVLQRLGAEWQATYFDPEVWADGLLAEAIVRASCP